MGSCNTFREELAITNPRHGHALWEPDPGGLCDSVAVGHVGFIRDGCFYPLFNALSPPSDSDSQGPKYPPQLQPKKSPHVRSSTDNQQYFCSDNVTRVSSDVNLYALGPDDETPLTFSCSGRKGALLYLPLLSERHDTVARGDFGEWMLENIDTCFKVAEDLGYGVERMEDIILVTGCHLAKSWINAAFSDSRGGSEISFGARASRNSGVHFDERNVNGRGLKLGPSGENLPQNQCIFVRGFRVARLLSIWPRLRGAGPAAGFGEREPESDRRLELISIPADTDYQDPLDILSTHIAEQAPNCNMILLHDDDLQFIGDAPGDSDMGHPSPSSTFQSLFDVALQDYEKQTGTKLAEHPLTKQLETCDSVDSITSFLQEQARAFQEFRGAHEKLMRYLRPVVHVLYTLSTNAALGESIGLLPLPPSKAIFAGFAVLLAAVEDITASYDTLVDLLESTEGFLNRLGIYTKFLPTPIMAEIIVKIMVELLSTLAVATKQVKLHNHIMKLENEEGTYHTATLMNPDALDRRGTRAVVQQTPNDVDLMLEEQTTRGLHDDIHMLFAFPESSIKRLK